MDYLTGDAVEQCVFADPVGAFSALMTSRAHEFHEEMCQVDVDEPGSHRIISHVAVHLPTGDFVSKVMPSVPGQFHRSLGFLTLYHSSGTPTLLVEAQPLSNLRTALIALRVMLDKLPCTDRTRLHCYGRGPIGQYLAQFHRLLKVPGTFALSGEGANVEYPGQGVFVVITEKEARAYFWLLNWQRRGVKVVVDLTKHAVHPDRVPDITYSQIQGSVVFDWTLLQWILTQSPAMSRIPLTFANTLDDSTVSRSPVLT